MKKYLAISHSNYERYVDEYDTEEEAVIKAREAATVKDSSSYVVMFIREFKSKTVAVEVKEGDE